MYEVDERYIYFIVRSDTHEIKIGMSHDPVDRLYALQIKIGVPLRLVGVLPTKAESDKYMHRKFKKYRTNGEWFMPVPRVLDFIDEHATLDIPELNLVRLNAKEEVSCTSNKAPALTIYQIKRNLRRTRKISRQPCMAGVYRPNDDSSFSKFYYRYYYQISDITEYLNEPWVFILPIRKNGKIPSDITRGRLMDWFPFRSLEWVTDNIESPSRKPKSPMNNLTIDQAKEVLGALDDGIATQIELAKRFGVSQTYISAIKLGKIKRYQHLLQGS